MTDRRLAAEARGVEDGQRARRVDDTTYTVRGRDFPDARYTVRVRPIAGTLYFDCDCLAAQSAKLCKHTQVVARRLERERRAELDAATGMWIDLTYVPPSTDDDPFEGLDF